MKFTPHDFRRSLITYLLDIGENVTTVGDIVGHADPRTTEIYNLHKEHQKKAAMQKVKF